MENLPVPGPRKRTPGGGPWWYARGDLNPYPCGMEPKSIVSANSTTGADMSGRKPVAILLSSDFYTVRKPGRSVTLDPQV